MKNIIFISALFLMNLNFVFAQSMNWQSLENSKDAQVYYNLAYDFGVTNQIGIAHKLNSKLPIVLQADFSTPLGDTFNDYKFRIGGQIGLLQKGNFRMSLQYLTLFRKHETNFVSQTGIGQWLSMTVGIYKKGWHVGAELGYDASIATYLKHTEEIQQNFSEIQDHWFVNTGGQWHYGLQASKKIGHRLELNLSLGATNARANDHNALLPMYFKLGAVYFFQPNGEDL